MSGSTAGEVARMPSAGIAIVLRRVTEALILVGTASLVYWPPIHRGPMIVPLRAELPFAIALVLAVIEMSSRPRGSAREALFGEAEARWTWIALGVLLGACLLATGLSWFRYHLRFDAIGQDTMLKLIFNLLIFALVYRALRTNAGLFQKLALALFLSTLVPLGLGLLVIIDPHTHAFLTGTLRLPSIVSGGARFQGLTSNPVMGTFDSLTGIAFFYVLALWGLGAGAWRVVGVASVVGGMGILVLWSQARSALIALLCLIAMAGIAGIRLLGRGLGQQILVIALVALVIFFGWRLVPTGLGMAETSPQILLERRLVKEEDVGSRLAIYRYYMHLIPSNPLGVGFNYTQEFVVDTPFQKGVASHSSFFELWMFGGFGAVFAAAAVLVFACARVRRELRAMVQRGGLVEVADVSYLAAALACFSYWIQTTLVGSPFDETINSVLLAMLLAGIAQRGVGEARTPIHALSGWIAGIGYLILLGLGLRTVL